ncbi:MAG TPA: protein kinase [Gemmatimonadaceae bacterium]|nr:protein kinase [Gemmatimonadaceae bacterium]
MSSDLRDQLQRTLGSSYTLERELGGGGMSRVFVAEDTALGRAVVVKVLPPELASGVSIERFKREISLAARLQHPHVVPLLSAGETGGLPYFTMPFVEGESLRARLARGDEIPVKDAVHLLREVASALAYAHRKGVIHRDIKPENVLISGQHAMVTDFGVAKAISDATQTDLDGLTGVGVALGTPAYMAPEQVAGDPGADHRADIYAFGVIAYETLAGRAPFAGRTAQALMAAHVVETPEPIGSRRVGIPAGLAALVMRCLEKDPDNRPAHAEDILRDLDDETRMRHEEKSVRPSVAVLPMVNTSGDPENEHFSDGLTDELIGVFSKVEGLTVTGRTSTFALKGKGLSVRAITDLLHVQHALEGSVRRAGDRLKVRVQLVDADGSVIWSDSYDRRLEDVFAVQEEIAQAVVRALEVKLIASRGPLVRPATKDLAAYDLFLKGRYVRRGMAPDQMRMAINYFEQAVARDPSYARAHAWLSDTHWLQVVLASRPTSEEVPRAREYAATALALDSSLPDAHWAMAQLMFGFDWNGPEAERAFRRAIQLDPGFEEAHHLYGIFLIHWNRMEEAEAELTRTLEIDPLLAAAHLTFGRLHLSMRGPDEAIAHLREALALEPMFSLAHAQLGHAYLQKAMPAQAIIEFEAGARIGSPSDRAHLAYGYAMVGRREEAAAIVANLASMGAHLPPFHMALAHLGLGDHAEAFRWLGQAREERDPWLTTLNIDRAFDPLRVDSQFDEIVRAMGLIP